jgi:hypothetical protein
MSASAPQGERERLDDVEAAVREIARTVGCTPEQAGRAGRLARLIFGLPGSPAHPQQGGTPTPGEGGAE